MLLFNVFVILADLEKVNKIFVRPFCGVLKNDSTLESQNCNGKESALCFIGTYMFQNCSLQEPWKRTEVIFLCFSHDLSEYGYTAYAVHNHILNERNTMSPGSNYMLLISMTFCITHFQHKRPNLNKTSIKSNYNKKKVLHVPVYSKSNSVSSHFD